MIVSQEMECRMDDEEGQFVEDGPMAGDGVLSLSIESLFMGAGIDVSQGGIDADGDVAEG